MLRRILITTFLLIATSALAASQAPDRRISDNDGDVLIINTDGTVPVTCVSGCGGGDVEGFGGTTATNGNILVADGNAFNSVTMSGDATINAAGVVSVSTPGVGASNLDDLADVTSSTATAGRILVSDGSAFGSEPMWRMVNSEIIHNTTDGKICFADGNVAGGKEDVCWDVGTDGQVSIEPLNGNATILKSNFATWRTLDTASSSFGNGDDVKLSYTTTGNDNFQIGIDTGAASAAGFVSIMQKGDMALTNRSPSPTTDNPTLRIYSPNELQSLDYVQIYYDPATSQGVIDVGQGTVFIADHLQVGAWTATAGNILVGDGASNFQSVALSGDVAITSTGALTIGSASVTATSGNMLVADGVKFNSVPLGSGLGFRVVTGANTACSTTCGSLARCIAGSDAVTAGFLTCADAGADSCLCGP